MTALTTSTANFPGRFESLERISQFVQKAAKQAGLDDDALYSVELAVDEACSNIIEHAYQGEDKGDIECTCEILPSGFKIILCDTGRPFNPEEVPEPDLTSPLEERKKGGLGLFFIDQVMDEARFEFTPGKNQLVLIKHK